MENAQILPKSLGKRHDFHPSMSGKKQEFCQRITEICKYPQKIREKTKFCETTSENLSEPRKRRDLCENVAVKHRLMKTHKFHEKISGKTKILAKGAGKNTNFIKESLKECKFLQIISKKT